MFSFKQFLDEALSVSNTHYKKYFDLVQSYVGANKRKEIVNGDDIKIVFLNGSKEIITLNYEGDGRSLELKSFIKDNKTTNINKKIRDTKSIRDLIGTPLDFYFSNKDSNFKQKKYKPATKKELKELCDDLSINLGDIDTSLITDMFGLFYGSKRTNNQFEGIEDWDMSNVITTTRMFRDCKDFNRDISKWDVSKVTYTKEMFYGATSFNQPLDKWNVSNVEEMSGMFEGAWKFNQPLNKWNVSKVVYMDNMFRFATSFNQPLNKWNVSKVENTYGMFWNAKSFNQNISNWELKKVRDSALMFDDCPIDDDFMPKLK